MSKVDDLRALREAKYARAAAYGAQNPKKPTAAPAVPETVTTAAKTGAKTGAKKKPEPTAAKPAEAPVEGCDHRNMMGRACTREQGHAAKSHRYS